MNEHDESLSVHYPHGRGYGHDYMRGGEVLGGYGYSARDEYQRSRGELRERQTSGVGSEETAEEDSG